MVAFARNNLIVLVGQWPDAHYIVMDQNQLSAYVQQDQFPLFSHGETGVSEFRDLLRRVMTDKVSTNSDFVDMVFAETTGHPFLTGDLMVDFCDWLVEGKRSVSQLNLGMDEFQYFSDKRLTKRAIVGCKEYDFFRQFMSDSLGPYGEAQTPWLHSVCRVIREIATQYPEGGRCSESDYLACLSN